MLRTRLMSMYPLFLDGEGDPSGPGTATVVAAPAPTERTNDSSPGLRGETDQGPLATALREMREAVQRGELTLAGSTPAQPSAVPPAGGETPEVTPAAGDPAATPAAKTGAEALAEAVTETTTEPTTEGGEGEEVLPEDDPLLTIELPARRGQEPIPIRVEDRETAEALRHMRNQAARTEVAEGRVSEVRAQQAELDGWLEHLRLDPVGLIVERADPTLHGEIARHLLAQPGVLESLLEQIDSWQNNPEVRRADASDLRLQRRDNGDRVRQAIGQRVQHQQLVEHVETHVGKLAELVDPDLVEQFRDDCLGDMAALVRTKRVAGRPAPERFPELLAGRLRLYGITPDKAIAALTDARSTPNPSSRPRPKGPDAEALAASRAAQGAKATGQQFITAKRVRQAAAAATPAPGAPVTVPANTRPPKGSGVKGAIQFLREQMGRQAPR